MDISIILEGILHTVPEDMKLALQSNADILVRWNSLTPIQRNEWICWVTIVKKPETRAEHITRMMEDMNEGKRTPCCWPGCPHRRPEAKKWFKNMDT
ncbi:MAG TPA: YdeI/OmpD-associated family protein [Saprospiraceae bacterium]|nr:YdeI/OmpD-associated family protein [Saprospiraceae bacterium]HRO07360.1 YdeI/OmpD-associated family protein [Saprospiraceae bacterium]HRO72767.1 YdeI/OmpD-associated family protein [Saprospiraceae bacterium]HRP40643.1 YdeI/OmpD-associated family protein [Saprospiraceae bacterium]